MGDFTYLEVKELLDESDSNNHRLCIAHCRLCGRLLKVRVSRVASKGQVSCGCYRSFTPTKDLTGTSTTSGATYKGYISNGVWRVTLPCGCEKDLLTSLSRNMKYECSNCQVFSAKRCTHGHSKRTGSSPTYGTWLSMKRRCYKETNNRYQYYGGKGITVCESWVTSFNNFLADMGERPEGCTLDRIDNTKGYCKENCVWSTKEKQANNKTNVKLISNGDKSMSLRYWCGVEGVEYKRAWHLIKQKGHNIQDVLGKDYSYVAL